MGVEAVWGLGEAVEFRAGTVEELQEGADAMGADISMTTRDTIFMETIV